MGQGPRLLSRWTLRQGERRHGRVKVTIEELTEQVLRLCIGGETTLAQDLHELREGLLQDVDREVALGELFMLRVCTAVYANQAFFKAAAQREVREVFNRCLHSMLMGFRGGKN